MVTTVSPNARDTPSNPIPSSGKAAASTALPHPPRTSQNAPRNSAPYVSTIVFPVPWRETIGRAARPGTASVVIRRRAQGTAAALLRRFAGMRNLNHALAQTDPHHAWPAKPRTRTVKDKGMKRQPAYAAALVAWVLHSTAAAAYDLMDNADLATDRDLVEARLPDTGALLVLRQVGQHNLAAL